MYYALYDMCYIIKLQITDCFTHVSLRIQSECGKIRTRKKLRIWTIFTQWSLFTIERGRGGVHILHFRRSRVLHLLFEGTFWVPDPRFLDFRVPRSSKVTGSWHHFYSMSRISKQHILKDRVFITL